jgi:hypothetical protein
MDYIKPAYCNETHVGTACGAFLPALTLVSSVPKYVDRVRVGKPRQRQHFNNASTLHSAALRYTNLSIIHSDLREYLEHIMKSTNMSCLTAEAALSGDCDFLSANMYARSVFGMSVHVSAYHSLITSFNLKERMLWQILASKRMKRLGKSRVMFAFEAKHKG